MVENHRLNSKICLIRQICTFTGEEVIPSDILTNELQVMYLIGVHGLHALFGGEHAFDVKDVTCTTTPTFGLNVNEVADIVLKFKIEKNFSIKY